MHIKNSLGKINLVLGKGGAFMENMQYVKGEPFFNRVNKVTRQYKYLTEDIDTEVIIIGGGVTGAILSYYFSKKDISNVVVKKKGLHMEVQELLQLYYNMN